MGLMGTGISVFVPARAPYRRPFTCTTNKSSFLPHLFHFLPQQTHLQELDFTCYVGSDTFLINADVLAGLAGVSHLSIVSNLHHVNNDLAGIANLTNLEGLVHLDIRGHDVQVDEGYTEVGEGLQPSQITHIVVLTGGRHSLCRVPTMCSSWPPYPI